MAIAAATAFSPAHGKDDIPYCHDLALPTKDGVSCMDVSGSDIVTIWRDSATLTLDYDLQATPSVGSYSAGDLDVLLTLPSGASRTMPVSIKMMATLAGYSLYLVDHWYVGERGLQEARALRSPRVIQALTRNRACHSLGGGVFACSESLTTPPPLIPDQDIATATNWEAWSAMNFNPLPAYAITDPTATREQCRARRGTDGLRRRWCQTIISAPPYVDEYRVDRDAPHRIGDPSRAVANADEIDALQIHLGYAQCTPRDAASPSTILCSNRAFTLSAPDAIPTASPLPPFPRPPYCVTTFVAGPDDCIDTDEPEPTPPVTPAPPGDH